MHKTIIIDDDQLARRGLRRIIEQNFQDIEIVGEADSVSSGIELISKVEPELIFLDIEMPDGSGFRLLEKLPKVDFKVVFTTSYSDYAITAFKYSAFDYIVKPVLIENVRSTINRINEIPVLHGKQRVEVLKRNLSPDVDADQTIALPDINGFTIVKVSEIVRCEGERNYSKVFFTSGASVLVSRTLLDFDNMLVPLGFFRIHRSHLINLRNVNRYLKTDGGMVEMKDKTQLPISPKFKDEFLNRLLYNRI